MFLKYILLEVKLPYDPMYYLSATFLCPQNIYSQEVVSPLKKIIGSEIPHGPVLFVCRLVGRSIGRLVHRSVIISS